MSYSANKRNKSFSNKVNDIGKGNNKQKEYLIHKTYSPKNNNYNLKLIPTHETDSTKATNANFTFFKEKEFTYNSYPIKPINKDNIEHFFIPKQHKIYRSPKIINNKKISFQRQKENPGIFFI